MKCWTSLWNGRNSWSTWRGRVRGSGSSSRSRWWRRRSRCRLRRRLRSIIGHIHTAMPPLRDSTKSSNQPPTAPPTPTPARCPPPCPIRPLSPSKSAFKQPANPSPAFSSHRAIASPPEISCPVATRLAMTRNRKQPLGSNCQISLAST